MKSALVALAALLLLAGCGRSNPQMDPFVGTWRAVGFDPGDGLIISKVSNGYRVVLRGEQQLNGFVCWRHGSNEFKAVIKFTNPDHPSEHFPDQVEIIDFHPASGHLTWKESSPPVIELSKVSGSTTAPTPSPTTSLWPACHDPTPTSRFAR